MQNHDQIVELQNARLSFSNFIAAALFGRLCGMRHVSLSGARYTGMADILGVGSFDGDFSMESSTHSDRILMPKLAAARREPNRMQVVLPAEIEELVTFISNISARGELFSSADIQICMNMNYQASILHNKQHAAASLSLNFSVAEALIDEIFLSYGLVGNHEIQYFATNPNTVAHMSKKQFKDLWIAQKISILEEGGLINYNLADRLNLARRSRNGLLHRANPIAVSQSGELQTVVRDLWAFFIDPPFELNSGWSMRL